MIIIITYGGGLDQTAAECHNFWSWDGVFEGLAAERSWKDWRLRKIGR